ncbi:M28 family peptidase [Candidatus Brocadia sinica]|uniref:Hypothetial protein n=1 Tax=Candidatus Brocadia sinica JPN1 TaxID=1197129 RepID=A0ABQ0K3Y2_9BACT|nr:M28 family peptidase [Candidatus Brocadia sinica]GAN35340.1 hypothetial protein [Candidatus Brocadia sinica JPN1]
MKQFISIITFTVLLTAMCFHWGVINSSGSEKGEEQFLANIRQLTIQGKSAGEGYFSQDGKYLIFQSERDPENPFYQIYIMSLETGDTHRVSPGIGKTTCSFFRNNSEEVLFASTHLDPDAKENKKQNLNSAPLEKNAVLRGIMTQVTTFFSTKRDGTTLKRLTDAPGYDAEGAYSPDGNKIVFCSLRDAYPVEKLSSEDQKRMETSPSYFGEIYIMNADGSEQKRLTNWPGYDGGPFFSHDGKRIIWRHFNENGMLADVYTMLLDGSDVRRLTDFKSMSWAPYFHPSGDYVIFHSNKFGFTNCELFIVDALGEKEPVRVTFHDKFDGLPVFAPDGKRLAWTSGRTANGDSQLFLADWDHEAALKALQLANVRSASQPAQTFSNPESLPQKVFNSPPYKDQIPEKTGHQFSPKITATDLRAEVQYLASDELEGRLTGTKGTQLAANYIADYFKGIGLKAIDSNKGYFQEFPFIAGTKIIPEQNHFQITKEGTKKETIQFVVNKDFAPLSFTVNGEVEGEVVFAGYGLSVPGNEGNRYDSYEKLDVKDKIVVVLHHVPEKVDMKRHLELTRYAGLRYKTMIAREHGAKALLVVTGPKTPSGGELFPLFSDKESASSGIIAASVSGKIAEALFAGSGKNLETIQAGLDVEDPQTEAGFDLPNVKIRISTAVEQVKEKDRNVLGLLPPCDENENAEYIIIGAHYDHIGRGGIDSLARKGEEGMIHNGADDNASGVSTVLELAAALAAERETNPQLFKRGIIFALWSGEELGCLGSSYFIEHPTIPLKNVIAYVNFDMVGRLSENNLIVEGIGSSNTWARLIEKCNVTAGFNVKLHRDPYLPTDATAFYSKEVPIIHFFTGVHEDYNRPTDDPGTLNYDGMVRIAEFARAIVIDLIRHAERPDYVKVAQSGESRKEKVSRRTYWGTVPDFASENSEGVKISTVKLEGPADKAGMKDGDIIVEIAGKKITNIYDYNYMMDAAGVGKPVEVVVLRDGKREILTIIPVARK